MEIKNVELLKGNKYEAEYGLCRRGIFQPYSVKIGNNVLFISNLMTHVNNPLHRDDQKRSELAIRIRQLRNNNYKFICFYAGVFSDPVELIKWAKSQNKTFLRHGDFYRKSDGFVDFHGNFKEVSCAFMFRIYDKALLIKIKREMKSTNKYIHY